MTTVEHASDDADHDDPWSITVLTTTDGARLAKVHHWHKSGVATDTYGWAKTFKATSRCFADLTSLARIIESLRREKHSCVVRGVPSENANPDNLSRKKTDIVQSPKGKGWLAIDLDRLEMPHSAGLENDEDKIVGIADAPMVVHAIIHKYLPTYFHNISAFYVFSSSAGVKPWSEVRLRLYYVLDSPVTDVVLKTWARRQGNLDIAIYSSNQPNYTADPIFDGMRDPCEGWRTGFLRGRTEVLTIPAEDLTAASRALSISSADDPSPLTDEDQREVALAELHGRASELSTTTSGRNTMLNTHTFALAGYVAHGLLTKDEIADAMWNAAESCGLVADEFDKTRDTLGRAMDAGVEKPRARPGAVPRGNDVTVESPVAPPVPTTNRSSGDEPDSVERPAGRVGKPKRHAVTVQLSTVEVETVSWLWDPWVPLGKLTLLEGDPGLGKTFLALQIAACVSRGLALPGLDGKPCGETKQPANVIYMSAEDGLGDTLRPRLDAMEADVSRMYVLTSGRTEDDQGEHDFSVSLSDIDVLEDAMMRHRPRLVVVDPLQAYLGASVDMHRANETRPVLAALASLAERHGAAILLIRHLSKATQRSIHRGLGSVDIVAASRSAMLVAEHPDKPNLRVLAHVKSSLAPTAGSQSFEISDGRFMWTGPVELSAEQLSAPPKDDEDRNALADAKDFLLAVLADGEMEVNEVNDEAKSAKVTLGTLRRAKGALGVNSNRRSKGNEGGGGWFWSLPDKVLNVEHLTVEPH